MHKYIHMLFVGYWNKLGEVDALVLGLSISNEERRMRLYDKLSRDLDENGAAFLKYGETSQSLSLSELFTVKDGAVTPVLTV